MKVSESVYAARTRYCSDPRARKRWLMYGAGSLIIVTVIIVAVVLSVDSSDNGQKAEFRGSSVLDEYPLVDGHNDLPWQLYSHGQDVLTDFDFDSDLSEHPVWSHLHTDLPRLRQGKVGGQFWVAYVSCGSNYKDAVELTLQQIDVIKRLIQKYPNDLEYVTTADGIGEAFNNKKIASLICVEGGHSIDSRMAVLRLYYELGVRYMTLTHSCNLPWVDASPIDDTQNVKRNLTAWGEEVVWEMNRLGMMVDISHVSEGVMRHAIQISKAPVIFSHSSSFEKMNHHRNVKDDVLRLLKDNNGIIMVNFYPEFVAVNATIQDVADHINHIRDIIGTDNIGLGGDYDGVGYLPVGLEDVSKFPDLLDLLATGENAWTQEDLIKLAGKNLVRVFKAVEGVRDSLKNVAPYDTPIPNADMFVYDDMTCRTDLSRPSDWNAEETAAAAGNSVAKVKTQVELQGEGELSAAETQELKTYIFGN